MEKEGLLQKPWMRDNKEGEDAMTRKAEENMTRIGAVLLEAFLPSHLTPSR